MASSSLFAPSGLTGAVMAGGASRRMGQDKALLSFDGEPLWLRQARILREAGAVAVGVVRQREQSPLALPADIALWHDTIIGAGPLAGLQAALTACRTDRLAVLATDMPRIDAGWFAWLLASCPPGGGAVALHPHHGLEPLAAIYPRSALAEVTHRLTAGGPRSLQSLVEQLIAEGRVTSVPLPPAEIWRVANWNTPAEVGAAYESKPTAFATAS
jgi:molybdopterin-guanine dinucleotide biosynthesis protein A